MHDAANGADEARPGDMPVYLSDCRSLFEQTGWRPRRDPGAILGDVLEWVRANERPIREALDVG